MNQKKAKKIRRMVYGQEGSKQNTGIYYKNSKTGALIVDPKGKRKEYKDAKKIARMGVRV